MTAEGREQKGRGRIRKAGGRQWVEERGDGTSSWTKKMSRVEGRRARGGLCSGRAAGTMAWKRVISGLFFFEQKRVRTSLSPRHNTFWAIFTYIPWLPGKFFKGNIFVIRKNVAQIILLYSFFSATNSKIQTCQTWMCCKKWSNHIWMSTILIILCTYVRIVRDSFFSPAW